MAIAQDAFYIPDDIATGLATGIYKRIGSVVRYAVGDKKGQIVKHLKPIDLKAAEQAKGLGEKAIDFVQLHKKEAGIVAIGVAVLGVGIWGYNKWKSYEPKVLCEFRTNLKIYIEAIRSGNMDVDIIDDLMKSLELLKKHKDLATSCDIKPENIFIMECLAHSLKSIRVLSKSKSTIFFILNFLNPSIVFRLRLLNALLRF